MINRVFALTVATLALPSPVAAEVVQMTETGFTTRDSVVVKGTPFEAWQALIAPARWWNKGHTWSGETENLYISAQANGCFCELLPPPEGAPEDIRRGSALHMTVIMADPGKALRMRGGLGPLQSEPADGVLTVTLSPTTGGTRIVWEYVVGGPMRYDIPMISKAVDGVMSEQLRGLAHLLGPVAVEQEAAPAKDADKPAPEGQGAQERQARPGPKQPDGDAAKPEERAAPKPKVEEAFGDLIGEE